MTIGPEPRIRTLRGRSASELFAGCTVAGLRSRVILMKRSYRYWLSCGPGHPSGWYCTLNTGSVRWPSPSTDPSLRLRCETKKSPSGSESASTWNSWFWLVMCTRPDSRSLTGWLAPWWPNFRREVVPPAARPTIWWPRQMPISGILPSASLASLTGPSSTDGSPGPFDSTSPSTFAASTSAHSAVCGRTTTRQPRSRNDLRMLVLTP